jgi:hypothetical protein
LAVTTTETAISTGSRKAMIFVTIRVDALTIATPTSTSHPVGRPPLVESSASRSLRAERDSLGLWLIAFDGTDVEASRCSP